LTISGCLFSLKKLLKNKIHQLEWATFPAALYQYPRIIIADREKASKTKRKANKRKLELDQDDLENSMLVEIAERPAKKTKRSVNPKKRPLEDANVIIPAKRPRGRPRKTVAQ